MVARGGYRCIVECMKLAMTPTGTPNYSETAKAGTQPAAGAHALTPLQPWYHTRTHNGTQPTARKHALTGSIQLIGAQKSFARNTEIYGETEPADYIYKVVSGAVRTCKWLSSGRRQIGAFYLPGDFFGLAASEEHTFSAEAITDSTILVIRRSAVTALAARDCNVVRQLYVLTTLELERVREDRLLLVKGARQRVAGFLLQMASRVPGAKESELSMPRQDIADYLGLTIETVSRTLTQLAAASVIALRGSRRIELRNRNALSRLNG
jgi:CRP/FNR family transcriptional regulator, nitrogen fixation regulation protein